MIDQYSILFLGDVVGKPGRTAIAQGLGSLQETYQPLFTVVNGENAAGGVGITPSISDELFSLGIDAITLGNHAFNKREILPYLDSGRPIVRPGNVPLGIPGVGLTVVSNDGIDLAIMNLCGRVFMDSYGDPFASFNEMVQGLPTPHRLLDFHAEATSEKVAMGYHADGRASVVVGTHTHVATADERILPGGTATITDVGMCGPEDSVLGMDKTIILERFRTTLPRKFEVGAGVGVISGVKVDVERVSGRAVAIERVRWRDR